MGVIVRSLPRATLPSQRRSVLESGIWLIFLADAAIALVASRPPMWRATLGWVGLAVFAATYLGLFWWNANGLYLWFTTGKVRLGALVGLVAILALGGLLTVASPAAGIVTLAYPVAFAIFELPLAAFVVVIVMETAAVGTLLLVDPPAAPWTIGAAISVGVVSVLGFLHRSSTRAQIIRAADQDLVSRLEERERIASDVHDLLGQTLTVMAMKAELVERLVRCDPDAAAEEARALHGLSRESLRQVRELVAGMRQVSLDSQLTAARTALQAGNVTCQVIDERTGAASSFDTVRGWVLREAVTNVVRHAQAHSCRIEVTDDTLAVTDDGRGRGDAAEGNGLAGMRRRVETAGGELWIGPGDRGRGTRILVTG